MKHIKIFEEFEREEIYLNENNIYLNHNFWHWFGKSKIVDSDKKPLIVYHGTNSEFSFFDDKKKGSVTDNGLRGRGFYFANNIKTAKCYGVNIYQVYLKIENPLDLLSFNSLDEIAELLDIDVEILHENGRGEKYHSIKIYNSYAGVFSGSVSQKGFDGVLHGQEIVCFRSEQIKSIENNGVWSVLDDNIYS